MSYNRRLEEIKLWNFSQFSLFKHHRRENLKTRVVLRYSDLAINYSSVQGNFPRVETLIFSAEQVNSLIREIY
jgi:hypothetical protein